MIIYASDSFANRNIIYLYILSNSMIGLICSFYIVPRSLLIAPFHFFLFVLLHTVCGRNDSAIYSKRKSIKLL
ncbi:hypothetical protein DFJ43DRAFT_1070900 [Lentinula guzmanii]|uniref:Uncharacterized protein n=1 Tax=Lentinula guzmanii TaxID=2804957 RepID=A0AA38JBE2_9AGAR|nr:hypothetical protein DFJ43DRAFT_1070900 [Lentinula guzmanii]